MLGGRLIVVVCERVGVATAVLSKAASASSKSRMAAAIEDSVLSPLHAEPPPRTDKHASTVLLSPRLVPYGTPPARSGVAASLSQTAQQTRPATAYSSATVVTPAKESTTYPGGSEGDHDGVQVSLSISPRLRKLNRPSSAPLLSSLRASKAVTPRRPLLRSLSPTADGDVLWQQLSSGGDGCMPESSLSMWKSGSVIRQQSPQEVSTVCARAYLRAHVLCACLCVCV
jgi:hypothetical protein